MLTKTDNNESLATLRKWLKPGDTIYTILRHVSSSGMSRRISFVIFKDGKPLQLDYHIEALGLGYRRSNKEGVSVSGCGMDMGFHVVYNLGRKLWPNGTPKPHGMRNGEPDSDGGYALKHSWL